jgi:hypothetical protein
MLTVSLDVQIAKPKYAITAQWVAKPPLVLMLHVTKLFGVIT